MENKKLIVVTGRNGAKVSIRPDAIVSAMPDEKIIGETLVVLAIGTASAQMYIRMSHDQFAKIWEAALNGKDAMLN